MLNKFPRNWLIIGIVFMIGLLTFFGWRQWTASDDQTSDDSSIETTLPTGESVTLIAAQQHFTFTIPAGWTVQSWQRDEIVERSESISQQLPRMRDSLARLLAAFQPDSQVLLLQPAAPNDNDSIFLLLSIPAHGLRLEQIADQFASETAKSRLIDTTLRNDGQPILRIRGEQLTGLDSLAIRPKQIAVINHYQVSELILIIEVQPSQKPEKLTESTFMDDILRSIEFIASS